MKFLDSDNIKKLLLTYDNKAKYPIYDIHISDWKNSTFLSAKECQGELKLMVCGVLKDDNDKKECLEFIKELINLLNNVGILHH